MSRIVVNVWSDEWFNWNQRIWFEFTDVSGWFYFHKNFYKIVCAAYLKNYVIFSILAYEGTNILFLSVIIINSVFVFYKFKKLGTQSVIT